LNRFPLHFSHANGFPAPAYASMLGELARERRVTQVAVIGEEARYPVTDGWPHLVDQLTDAIELEHRGAPVIGVGHSLGAYLTYIAAARRPELFRAIVLLDAPIVGPVKGRLLAATKRFGIVDRVTPAGATRDRRAHWDSRAQAKEHFRSRSLFRRFSDACLDDYVEYGLVAAPEGGYRLRIDPDLEYRIYRTMPDAMHRWLPQLRVSAGFVGGEDSDVLRRVGLSMMRGPRFVKRRVPGGHLFPFEHPREAAAAIENLVAQLTRPGA
jgi:pimeloyl-ACP methyl ester carboxylesterase